MAPLRKQEFHAFDDWRAAVEKARADLSITQASEPVIGAHLEEIGKESVAARVTSRYEQLVRRTGLHDRYIEYFAACALSHFDHSSAHRAPAWLCELLRRQRSSQHPVQPGTVRLEFHHGRPTAPPPHAELAEIIKVAFTYSATIRPVVGGLWTPRGWRDAPDDDWSINEFSHMAFTRSPDPAYGLAVTREPQTARMQNLLAELRSSNWCDVPIPYGLEVLWPYEVPMLSLDEEAIQSLATDLRNSDIITTWLLLDRLVAVHGGRWVMLPYRTVENWPRPLHLAELFALPSQTVFARLSMPIPFIEDGSGDSMIVEFETAPPPGKLRVPWVFRELGVVRPLQPEITADVSLPNDEAAFVGRWKLLTELAAVHQSVRPGRGASPTRVKVPGLHVHAKVVAGLYREKLIAYGRKWLQLRQERGEPTDSAPPKPSSEECLSLWNSAKREARRQILRQDRERIPDDIREAVEQEEPWKIGTTPGFTAPPAGG